MNTSSERLGLGHVIVRPVLCAELDKAFSRRLSLIVAQAGAGKSTLLRQWSAAHPEHAFVFLDAETADDNPAHFIRRLVADLAVVEPAMADASRLINIDDEGLGAPVIAALAAALKTMSDVVVVVDDAQRLTNVHLVADLGELVTQTPHNFHLVISSRSDPPIALSKYRLDDELLELRQADLAFNEEEAAELLERITGHPLAPFNVRALRERTEGWAAGLQLAGINLRHEQDPDTFIAEFGGSDRLVADYLGEEVLAFLPAGQRELLLHMSALDDMCASLVHAVTGCENAQSVLEQLQRDSMFLVPLDTRREWFRFHHLFRELLRSRLRVEGSSTEQRILSGAADWHLARGQAKSAVEYLLRAKLWDRALEAILSHALDVVAHGDMLSVVRWMQQIPESVRSTRATTELVPGMLQWVSESGAGPGMPSPSLGFFAAQMLLTTRPQISAAAAWHQLGEREATDPPDFTASATVVTAMPQGASSFRQALVAGGRASLLAGEMDQARDLLTRGLAGAEANSPECVSGLSTLSLLEAWCGNVECADTLICKALLAASEASMLADPAVADAYLASVLTALERAEGDPLDDMETQSLPALPGVLVPESEALSVVQRHILLARVAISDNNSGEATLQLNEAVKIAEIHGLVEVFLRAGPSILNRLSDVAGPQAAFRDIILARAQQAIGPGPQAALLDPLTDRELEILSYLPTRFTNVELAERCFVSVNTIKTHMVHIYRKLDATNRDAAIGRARALGLL